MSEPEKSQLSVDAIRQIAETTAEENWRKYAGEGTELLLDDVLSLHNAHMFFRNPSFDIPKRGAFVDFAIVVSSKGHLREIQNHYPDMEAAWKHLELMSEYFTRMKL